MKKIPYQDILKSITLFFVNEEVDKKYESMRKEIINLLRSQMSQINSYEGLQNYIREYDNSLSNLLIILGVSNELFKRVVSMFRIQEGMKFSTEWTADQTRRFILSNERMMKRICDLFMMGGKDASLRSQLPGFKLDNFLINENVMNRLKNDDFLTFLINRDLDTLYKAEVSNININRVDNVLSDICNSLGLNLIRAPKVDPVGDGTRDIQVNYAIEYPTKEYPLFYIKYSFNITTSRGQTDFKRSVKDLRDFIRNKNNEAKQIIVIDGAGWFGRQSDLRDAWDYSDYCLNLKYLDKLTEIIKI